jgi:hypothetical protein
MRKSLIMIPMLACLLAGCEEKAREAREAPATQAAKAVAALSVEGVRKMVTRYNQLLEQGYRDLNMTPLQEVATRELALKAYFHMAALGEGKARLISKLQRLDFEQIDTPSPTASEVQTREVWDFAHRDIGTGRLRQEVKAYVYHVHYTVEKQQGRWLITKISATGEEEPKRAPSRDNMLGHGKAGRGER